MSYTILITFFPPFDGKTKNISKTIAHLVYDLIKKQQKFLNVCIYVKEIPVVPPEKVQKNLIKYLEKYNPDLVLLFGETYYKTCVEKYANAKWEDIGWEDYYGGKEKTLVTSANPHWKNVQPFCNTIGNYSCSLAYYTALDYSIKYNKSQETVFIHINMNLQHKGRQHLAEKILHATISSRCGDTYTAPL